MTELDNLQKRLSAVCSTLPELVLEMQRIADHTTTANKNGHRSTTQPPIVKGQYLLYTNLDEWVIATWDYYDPPYGTWWLNGRSAHGSRWMHLPPTPQEEQA